MSEIVALSNQKGGVGKTTSALSLGIGLKRRGYRVLLVDMDSQCNLSYILCADTNKPNAYDIIFKGEKVKNAIQHTEEADVIAGNQKLSQADSELQGGTNVLRLKNALEDVQNDYDYIVIDSPPTLGVLTLNVFTAANSVVIPTLADIFSLQGIGQLYTTINAVKAKYNPYLRIKGILLTRYTGRSIINREMREMLEDTAKQIGTKMFVSAIRESVVIREAQASRLSIYAYAPTSKQAVDYDEFIDEFITR